MRNISPLGVALIKRFEGFSATPYICVGGYKTIGYGHVISASENFIDPISKQEAEQLLEKDIQAVEKSVLRLIDAPLLDCQFDALVSFTFNLGSGALQRSTLRRKINDSAHGEVPEEMMRWVYAGGKKLRGLVLRRMAEAEHYMSEPS